MKTKHFLLMIVTLCALVCAQWSDAQIIRNSSRTTTTGKSTSSKRTPSSNKTSSAGKKTRSARTTQRTATAAARSATPFSSNPSGVYSVSFTCDMNDADLYIDASFMGDANGTYNLKAGSHEIQVVAEGCEDYTTTINVSASRKSFTINMNKERLESLTQMLIEDMVFVQGGSFTMGSSDEENAEYDEKPSHEVKLSSFYICRFEVTQELWEIVMGNNPSTNVGENLPVESVSWDDCQMFIQQLRKVTGIKFRLPTEAEWEYAARGGAESRHYRYAGSDSIDEVAWYYNFDETTHMVGTKAPNELGLYDMSGNVMEWCSDWHGRYRVGIQRNPTGPKTGEYRVARGGFWESEDSHCTVTYRAPIVPDEVSNTLGLRLAATSLRSKR